MIVRQSSDAKVQWNYRPNPSGDSELMIFMKQVQACLSGLGLLLLCIAELICTGRFYC